MMAVETQASLEAYRAAVHLSEAENPLPEEASRAYQGPDALGQSTLRAGVFATLGWIGGHWLGGLGSWPKHVDGLLNPDYRSFKAKNFALGGAFIGAVMGAYGGMKDARFHREQVEGLQSALRGQHTKVADLKDELRRQLAGEGRLKHYEPEWEEEPVQKPDAENEAKEEKPRGEKPENKVTASDVQHDAALESKDKSESKNESVSASL